MLYESSFCIVNAKKVVLFCHCHRNSSIWSYSSVLSMQKFVSLKKPFFFSLPKIVSFWSVLAVLFAFAKKKSFRFGCQKVPFGLSLQKKVLSMQKDNVCTRKKFFCVCFGSARVTFCLAVRKKNKSHFTNFAGFFCCCSFVSAKKRVHFCCQCQPEPQ